MVLNPIYPQPLLLNFLFFKKTNQIELNYKKTPIFILD